MTGAQVRITFRSGWQHIFSTKGSDGCRRRHQFALTNEILSEEGGSSHRFLYGMQAVRFCLTQVFEIYVTAAIPWTDAVEKVKTNTAVLFQGI